MPVPLTYPGVYIEELPSAVRTITGVGTSITAFVGRAKRGPTNKATTIHGFAEYAQIFGGLWAPSTLGYAVQHYFLNGGADAIIVRVANGAAPATITLAHRRGKSRPRGRERGRVGPRARSGNRLQHQQQRRHESLQPDGALHRRRDQAR